MKVNRNNYEIWFLDYYEGRLSPVQAKELMAFLDLHYDLKEEFNSFENITLPPAKHIVFDAKESLKKDVIISVGSVNEKNYAEYFVAAMEGDLGLSQLSELKEFLNKNPHLHSEYKLFGHTKLTVDTAIIFNRKEQLKKAVAPVSVFKQRDLYYAVSIAASVIILIAIYFLLPESGIHTVITADRSNFNINRKVQQNTNTNKQAVNIDNSINKNYYTNNNSVNKNSGQRNEKFQKTKNPVELKDFQYATKLTSKQIPENSLEKQTALSKITVYGDSYAMMQEKRRQAEEEKEIQNNDNKFLSLKDFALFKFKKSIAPDDKKDKIQPGEKLTVWDLAEAGANKINNLAGADLKIEKKDNEFAFAIGNVFEISRSSGK